MSEPYALADEMSFAARWRARIDRTVVFASHVMEATVYGCFVLMMIGIVVLNEVHAPAPRPLAVPASTHPAAVRPQIAIEDRGPTSPAALPAGVAAGAYAKPAP